MVNSFSENNSTQQPHYHQPQQAQQNYGSAAPNSTSPLPKPKLFGYQSLLSFKFLNAMRHPGEIPWLVVAYVFTIFNYLMLGPYLIMISNGQTNSIIAQLSAVMIYSPILIFLARGIMYGGIRLRGVRITPTQFPEAYQMVVEAAYVAGLRRVPDAYVVLGNGVLNAFASGHGHRRFIAIHSDLFEVGGAPRSPQALRFIIGHEVGHIAAGHVGYFRLLLTSVFNQIPVFNSILSRAQEYTADNFGYRFCAEGAKDTMRILSAGKYLYPEVNFDELANRAVYERGFFTWLANLGFSHPPTTWRSHALRDRSRGGSLFLRPKRNPPYPLSMIPAAEASKNQPDPIQAMEFCKLYPENPENQHWGTTQTLYKTPADDRDRKITTDHLSSAWIPPYLKQQIQWAPQTNNLRGQQQPLQQADYPQQTQQFAAQVPMPQQDVPVADNVPYPTPQPNPNDLPVQDQPQNLPPNQ